MMRQNSNLKSLKAVDRLGYGELRNYNAKNSFYIHFVSIIALDCIKKRITRIGHHNKNKWIK